EHPPVFDEPVPSEHSSRGRDRKRDREEPERPEPGLDLELANRIRAELVVEELPGDPGGGNECREEESDFAARRQRPATSNQEIGTLRFFHIKPKLRIIWPLVAGRWLPLKILPQIHARIHRRHLIRIAVEH